MTELFDWSFQTLVAHHKKHHEEEDQAIAQLRADLEAEKNRSVPYAVLTNENELLRAELDDAIELAEEGWGYADEYFQKKWKFKERLAELKAKAHPERK